MNVIAIDIGSSRIKCCVLSLTQHQVIHSKIYDTPKRIPHVNDLFYEISLREIIEIVENYIYIATTQFKVDSLYLSTQMHGYVYSESPHYVSWQDSRSLRKYKENTVLEYIELLLDENDLKKLSIPVKSSMGIFNLFSDSLLEDNFNTEGELFTLGSFLIHHLTGNNVTHITNASPLGIIDIEQKDIHYSLIEKLSLSKIKLPNVTTKTDEICGVVSFNNQSLNVYPDFGDQQVSILGADAKEDEFIFNMATAAQICTITKSYCSGSFEVRPYFYNKFLLTQTNLPSGRNLDMLVDFIQSTILEFTDTTISKKDVYERLNSIEFSPSDLQVNSQFFNSNGGNISKITPHNFDITNLVNAMYEDFTRAYKLTVFDTYKAFKFTNARFLGGLSQNRMLIDLICNELSLNKILTSEHHNVFNGIYKIALVNAGLINDFSEVLGHSLKEG